MSNLSMERVISGDRLKKNFFPCTGWIMTSIGKIIIQRHWMHMEPELHCEGGWGRSRGVKYLLIHAFLNSSFLCLVFLFFLSRWDRILSFAERGGGGELMSKKPI
ncbi:hypothetical protein BDZ91DRAFT_98415 [Kalaharituber pfeilii]|nr:hypothetical protein BDZ91DRAFT_98415 [Kalaharituber pfeilii]